MPVAEGYVYADEAHAKTVDPGKYGCNKEPKFLPSYPVQDGWTKDGRRKVVQVPFEPVLLECGHDTRQDDRKCVGCPRL